MDGWKERNKIKQRKEKIKGRGDMKQEEIKCRREIKTGCEVMSQSNKTDEMIEDGWI